jgi:hypothetical protein
MGSGRWSTPASTRPPGRDVTQSVGKGKPIRAGRVPPAHELSYVRSGPGGQVITARSPHERHFDQGQPRLLLSPVVPVAGLQLIGHQASGDRLDRDCRSPWHCRRLGAADLSASQIPQFQKPRCHFPNALESEAAADRAPGPSPMRVSRVSRGRQGFARCAFVRRSRPRQSRGIAAAGSSFRGPSPAAEVSGGSSAPSHLESHSGLVGRGSRSARFLSRSVWWVVRGMRRAR